MTTHVDIDGLIYQGLTTIDRQAEPGRPTGSRAVGFSTDQKTWTCTLQPNVKWADGQPFGVEECSSPFSVSAQSRRTRQLRSQWQDVTVAAVGSDAVSFTLLSPLASFPLLPYGSPSSPSTSSRRFQSRRWQRTRTATSRPSGLGPFMVSSISRDRTQVTLKRNPSAAPARLTSTPSRFTVIPPSPTL